MDWVLDILKAYKEFGVAMLFLGLFLYTAFLLLKMLSKGRVTEIERCERMVAVVQQNARASEQQAQVMEKLRESIEADRRETERLRHYLETREQMRHRL